MRFDLDLLHMAGHDLESEKGNLSPAFNTAFKSIALAYLFKNTSDWKITVEHYIILLQNF